MNVGFVFCKVLWFFSGWTALLKQQWYLRVRLRLWGVEPVNYQQPTWHIYSRSWYYCKCDVFGTSASTLFSELVWQISSSCGTSIWKFELPKNWSLVDESYKVRSLQDRQQPLGRTSVLNPSSNSGHAILWITGSSKSPVYIKILGGCSKRRN